MQRFAIVLGIVVAGCGSDQPAAVDATEVDAPGPPSLAVVASPATVARGDTVTVTVTVTNFTLVNPTSGGAPKDGEGHFHYYLDDAVNYTAGWTPTVMFRTGPATALGAHTFRFVLSTSAHEEVMPKVEATASFTVQ